jgi:hypothetical protein
MQAQAFKYYTAQEYKIQLPTPTIDFVRTNKPRVSVVHEGPKQIIAVELPKAA